MAQPDEPRTVYVREYFFIMCFDCEFGPMNEKYGGFTCPIISQTFDLVVGKTKYHVVWKDPKWIINPARDEFTMISNDGTRFVFAFKDYLAINQQISHSTTMAIKYQAPRKLSI
jgi:hypothetical protein